MNKAKAACGHSDCAQDQKQVIIFSPIKYHKGLIQ